MPGAEQACRDPGGYRHRYFDGSWSDGTDRRHVSHCATNEAARAVGPDRDPLTPRDSSPEGRRHRTTSGKEGEQLFFGSFEVDVLAIGLRPDLAGRPVHLDLISFRVAEVTAKRVAVTDD